MADIHIDSNRHTDQHHRFAHGKQSISFLADVTSTVTFDSPNCFGLTSLVLQANVQQSPAVTQKITTHFDISASAAKSPERTFTGAYDIEFDAAGR